MSAASGGHGTPGMRVRLPDPTAPVRLVGRLLPAGVPLARPIVHAAMLRVFGGEPGQRSGPDGGAPWLPPDAVSWRVIGEPAAIAGGIRALLVQLLHPGAAAGVVDHSAYEADPLGRLARTSAYVTTATFGSLEQLVGVTRRVAAVHRGVAGRTAAGRPYRADDPRLLAWVAMSLTDSFLVADRRWSPRPVAPADADRFVREQSRIAALLDPRVDLDDVLGPGRSALLSDTAVLPMLDEGVLPTTVAELEQLMAGYAGELVLEPPGRKLLGFLRRPSLPAALRPVYRVLAAGAIGSLHPEQRDLLGLRWSRARAELAVARTGVLLTGLRTAAGVSPARVAAERRVAARAGRG